MELVKIKRNYQITLPQNLREKLNLAEGDYMEIQDYNGGLILKPVEVQPKAGTEIPPDDKR